jgi:hypothetical protein
MGYSLHKKPLKNQHIKIKTMQDVLFATFLYSAILSFVCCLRYQPSCAKTAERTTQELPTDEQNQADINPVHTLELSPKLEPDSALIEETLGAKDGFYEPAQIKDQVLEAVEAVEKEPLREVTTQDTSKLTLRQCRAVIREINKGLPKEDRIRQKINGKDAPADWLLLQIARHLEAQPATAIALEVVLKAC